MNTDNESVAYSTCFIKAMKHL